MKQSVRIDCKLICMSFLRLIASFVLILSIGFCLHIGIADLIHNGIGTNVGIMGIQGIDDTQEIWITTNDDPSIMIDYRPGDEVILDIEFLGSNEELGMIYFADKMNDFSQDNAITYVFKNGKNVIKLDNYRAEYLRLDIASRGNVSFRLNSISKESAIESFADEINILLLIVSAVALAALYELIKCAKTREDKISRIFWGILGLSIFCIFGEFILGESYYMYTGVGADTINQYYPYYIGEVNAIREGNFSIWNWDYGLGTSLLNNVAWTFDPFGILIVALGVIFGPGSVQHLLVWMQIVKLVVLYALGKKYFSYFLNDEFSKCISAYLLTFNGYMMLWGQHYFLGTSCVFAMLLLGALENFLEKDCKKGGWFVALVVAWILLFSYYVGYMILLVCAVYFLFRYFTTRSIKGIKEMLCDLGHCLWAVFSGLFAAGIIFIPACYYVMTNSTRLDSSDADALEKLFEELTQFSFSDVGERLSRLVSNNLLCIENADGLHFENYYEAPQLFCTIFMFFFFGQWIVYEIKNTKGKGPWTALVIKLVLVFLMIFNSATGLVLNAFAYASYRYTYLLFPFMGLCVGIVFQEVIHKKEISLVGVVIGCLLTVVSWGYSYLNCTNEVIDYVALIGVILLIGAILFLIMWKKNKIYDRACVILVCLLIVTTALDGWYTNCNRRTVTEDDFTLSWDSKGLAGETAEAIAWVENQDDSFYRMGKTYNNWNSLGEPLIEGYSGIVWYNSTLNSNITDYYEKIYESSNTDIFAIKLFRLDSQLDYRANDIVNTKYLLARSEQQNNNWKLIHTIGNVYIHISNNSASAAKWYTNTIPKEEFERLGAEEKAEVLLDTVVVESEHSIIYESSDAAVNKFYLKKPTVLEGEVDCSGEGILMIAVPDENGWELYVDGELTESINCNYGFKGVMLGQGHHNIRLQYSFPYGTEGLIMSVIGIIMILSMALMEKRYKAVE
ncbi:MAG: YfhO family protein [Lachnospiraceae bacterium]|nr:YfhO family protein [Lachnospiraceae bacterium]